MQIPSCPCEFKDFLADRSSDWQHDLMRKILRQPPDFSLGSVPLLPSLRSKGAGGHWHLLLLAARSPADWTGAWRMPWFPVSVAGLGAAPQLSPELALSGPSERELCRWPY